MTRADIAAWSFLTFAVLYMGVHVLVAVLR
jgi:hypothetical protein